MGSTFLYWQKFKRSQILKKIFKDLTVENIILGRQGLRDGSDKKMWLGWEIFVTALSPLFYPTPTCFNNFVFVLNVPVL